MVEQRGQGHGGTWLVWVRGTCRSGIKGVFTRTEASREQTAQGSGAERTERSLDINRWIF